MSQLHDWTEREIYVRTRMEIAEDFPDGAFWGYMEENGIDASEVIHVSELLKLESSNGEEEYDYGQ